MFFGAYDGFGLAGQHGGRGRQSAKAGEFIVPKAEKITLKTI